MEVVIAASPEFWAAGEVDLGHVGVFSPEPGKILFLSERLGTSVGTGILLHPRRHAQNAGVAPTWILGLRG